MIDALLYRLNRAVQHGAIALESKLVSHAVNLEPLIARSLVATYLLSHPIREDLGSPSRK